MKLLNRDWLIFAILVIAVVWLQQVLLQAHLSYGFTPDDWWPLAHFYLQPDQNLFSKILAIWKLDGVYTTYQVLYITALHHFFGFNFEAYQLTNHLLKALSAILVYPLILVIFKNRALAFLTSLLYAMAYSPVGTLEIAAKGSDFISICFMSIFLICYYYLLRGIKKGLIWEISTSLLLLLTIFLSPIRMYPLLLLIILIEIYSLLTKKITIKVSVRRLIILFLPYIIVLLLSPASIIRFLMPDAPRRILMGNWQLILHPFGSFGSLFLFNDYWKIFGTIQINSFTEYLAYLLTSVMVVLIIFSLFFALILNIPFKKLPVFLLKIILANIVAQSLMYVIVKHMAVVPANIRINYDSAELYPVYLSVFIMIISFYIYQKWNKAKDNSLLPALWMGTLFSFVFILLTWVFSDYIVIFKGVHSYLNIPALGSGLFISAVLVLSYNRVKQIKTLGKSLAPLVFLLVIPIFYINQNAINSSFYLSAYSMDANEQQAFRNRVWGSLKNFDNTRPALFYFKTTDDLPNGRFYEQSLLGRFSEWMLFQGNFKSNKCLLPVFIIDKQNEIKKLIATENNKKGILYRDYCGNVRFYKTADIYAFNLVNKQPIDIKKEFLKEIGL